MTCRATKKLFSAYMESELSEADRRRVASHLEQCSRCHAELDAVKRTITLLRWIPAVEPSPEFGERVMARARLDERRPSPFGWVGSWWDRLSIQMPWSLEVPAPVLASIGGLGMVAGALLTLRIVSLPAVADGDLAARVPAELGSVPAVQQGAPAPGADAAGTVAVAAQEPGTRDVIGSGSPAMEPVYGASLVDVGAGFNASAVPLDGRAPQPVGWGPDLVTQGRPQGPASVIEVEYVLRRVRIHPRQAAQQPVGMRVHNGYVTF